jgi:hypothetical protein
MDTGKVRTGCWISIPNGKPLPFNKKSCIKKIGNQKWALPVWNPGKKEESRSISIYDTNERDSNFVAPDLNNKKVEFKMLFHFFDADCDFLVAGKKL